MDNVTDSDIWKETNHGRTMSEGILELRRRGLFRGKEVLELGGGIANHTVLVLKSEPEFLVTTEINQERLDFTREAVLERIGDDSRCRYLVADWLDLPGVYDIVMTNPPFFASGKYNRRYFIDELILNSHKHLKPGGHLIFVLSSMADIRLTRTRMEENGYDFEIVCQFIYPWRDYYFSDPRFLEMCDNSPGSYFMKDEERWEVLYVVLGTLRPFETDVVH